MDALHKAVQSIGKGTHPCEWPPKRPWPKVELDLPRPDLWVFGYGSLMWHPGFPPAESRVARLFGYHRGLCVWSWVYRGTETSPGLVLGLDSGGSCLGVAHRVRREHRAAAAAYLYEREMVTAVYKPAVVRLRLDDGRRVRALTFVADRGHSQYAGDLSAEEAADVVRRAHGKSGPNVDYVANTVACLDRLGIPCPRLHRVNQLLGREKS
ncbi:MAG: gamma-glutamylcyclotransferase [Gammaproteobacteria bacterium]|nr:gamma-glutamylcyclotransferase [Gammaproteobacteria bacterium]